jgi:hypothetical protein
MDVKNAFLNGVI